MERHVKPIVALAIGAALFSPVLVPLSYGQTTLIESGNSILGPSIFGINAGPQESLNVSWFVVENNTSGVYTYGYNILNPVGDVAVGTTTPETFNSFTLSFNANAAGAVVSATAPSGGTFVNNGANGLTWNFPDVSAGSTSPLIAFQSSLAPAFGNASVSGGAIPPSPWSSVNPNGQQVPVPRPLPEPSALTLLGLAFSVVPFRAAFRRFRSLRQD